MTAKTPPNTLGLESRKLWLVLNRSFKLEHEKMLILKTALEQYDLYLLARAEVSRDGFSVPTAQGIKTHPAVGAMKTARDGFLAAWRLLGIDAEVGEVGRPTDKRELKWQDRLRVVSEQ